MKLKLYEEVVIHQEGFPYTVVKKKHDGYYWRQPTHYSADWIKYDLPDEIIEPQLDKYKSDDITHRFLLGLKTGEAWKIYEYLKENNGTPNEKCGILVQEWRIK